MLVIKNPPANARDARDKSSVPGSGRSPGVGNDIPLQYSCHGQRSLVGYGPWGHKESDTSEQLSTQLEVLGVGVGIMKEVIFEKLLYNRCCIVGILLYDGYIQCYHI